MSQHNARGRRLRWATGRPLSAGEVIADALEVVAGVPNPAYTPRATVWAARRIALADGPAAVECLRATAIRAGLDDSEFDRLAELGREYAARVRPPAPRVAPVVGEQLRLAA
jgi:hypothetical protein